MRIISKFHDYYDSVLSYGDDSALVYVRNTEDHKILEDKKHPLYNVIDAENNRILPYRVDWYDNTNNVRITPELFYICGKTNVVFKLEHGRRVYYSDSELANVEYHSDIDTVVKRATELTKIDFETYVPGNRHYFWRDAEIQFLKKSTLKQRIETLEADIKKTDRANDILIHYNQPIARLAKTVLTVNPRLLDYDIQKKFDPWTLFQEIEMYAGGVLKRNDAMTCEIADKDRIAQHGFDKWSFRKMPEPK